jgi:hypothetical protein
MIAMKALVEKVSASKTSPANSDSLFLLSVLSPIVTIFGILSFASGWSFLAHYYDYFGLNLGDANIGVYGLLTQGLGAMQIGSGRVIIVLYVLVGTLLIFIRVSARNNKLVSLVTALIIFIVILITTRLAGSAGESAAERDAGDQSSLPNVTINAGSPTCQAGKLVRRKESVYFISRIHNCGDESHSISLGVVTVVPSDTVLIDHYMR